ncbi:MAG TPA: glycosyltransferase [Gemmatimonadaceae bacterium]|nr:glycosyltransferase [Gemmatimonadaceae bacterium]
MPYALFAAIPLIGHLNPLIRQAEELGRRGWRVAIAAHSERRAHVALESPALEFVDLGPLGAIAAELRRTEEAASRDPNFVRGTLRIVRGLGAVWPSMYDGLLASISSDRPDIVIADLFSSAAMCAAERAGVPFAVNNPDLLASLPVTLLPPADQVPFLFSGKSIRDVGRGQRMTGPIIRRIAALATTLTVGRDLNAYRASRGLTRTTPDALLRDHLILVDGAFGLEYERPLPRDVHMVGPMMPDVIPALPDDLARWLADGPPVVYVNLGTMAVATDAQLAAMLDALTSDRFRALWILAAPQQARLARARSASVRVESWGPAPAAVLRHENVRVFVSHCGINSVHESIVAGTPIVGIPMFADQRDMAIRVADAGVGVWIDKRKLERDALRSSIVRVMDDASFAAAIPKIQAAFARAGGVRRAADLITQRLAESRRA